MKRFVIGLCCVGFWVGTSLRAEAPYPSTPRAVVEEYLRLDADATGLSPSTWPEMGRLTNFPESPKWESFVVIDRYEIEKVLEAHSRAQVRVVYYPVGALSDHFVADANPEHVIFYLILSQGQWKVDSPPGMPHVALTVMKKRLDASSAANPKLKKANDLLLQQIENAHSKPK